jgi:hypothetical protein
MAPRRTRWLRVLPTATLTVVPFVVMGPTAQAFFPPITGSNPPAQPPVVVVPPVPPPPFSPPPTVQPPVNPPPVVVVPVDPHCVPEPSTLVAGLIGLAAAGIARRRKKKGDENPA